MPTYVNLAKWTEQGVRNVKDTVTRNQQVWAVVEQTGGQVIGTWWTQGTYDIVGVFEFPDGEAASAMATPMVGNVRTETLPAYNADEMQRILQKLRLDASGRLISNDPVETLYDPIRRPLSIPLRSAVSFTP
jgi:uncharacterized protein with GYD domain